MREGAEMGRKMGRIDMKKVGFGLLGLLVVLIALSVNWVSTVNRYKTPDTLSLSILDDAVTIRRDKHNVPYIFAQSEADLIRAQGFVVAQDRLFQMEFYRALINGRLSELVGEAGYTNDVRARVLDVAGNARRHAAVLDAAPRAYLQNYADGVNAYLSCCTKDFPLELSLVGIDPEPWTIADIISVMHFVGLTHGRNMEDELLTTQLVATLGAERAGDLLPVNFNPDRTAEFSTLPVDALPVLDGAIRGSGRAEIAEYFPQFGSNNWAVAPSRSASGQAVLANDPHLDARILPGPWIPMGLFAPGVEAFGLALPGLPGFLVGRTQNVAWGVTNGYGDAQDLFIEEIDPATPSHVIEGVASTPLIIREEIIRVKDGDSDGGFRDEKITIRSTSRGPIVTDHAAFGPVEGIDLSLRWTLAGPQRGQIGVDRFMSAKNAEEFEQAIFDIDVMFFNIAFADRQGAIGRRSSGRVPVRKNENGAYPQSVSEDAGWAGWIPKNEMPSSRGEATGWVATANNDLKADGFPYFYSSHFSPAYRYSRIRQMLSDGVDLSMEDHWRFIQDDLNLQAEILAPRFAAVLETDAALAPLAVILRDWDHRDDRDAIGPSVFHALYENLYGAVFDDELGADLATSVQDNRYFWLEGFDQLLQEGQSIWFDDVTTEGEAETLDDLIIRAGHEAKDFLERERGKRPKNWKWGDLHTVQFRHPLRPSGIGANWLGHKPAPMSGSGETVLRGWYGGREDYTVKFFDSARFVTDFGNDDYVIGALSGGVTARVWHPGFKSLLSPWIKGDYTKFWIDPELAKANANEAITLTPQR